MNAPLDSVARLRTLSVSELTQVGAESLCDHLLAQAVVAHCKYAPFTFDKLEELLSDPECGRYPTRLVFEFGEMEDEFYEAICHLADFVGAEVRLPDAEACASMCS